MAQGDSFEHLSMELIMEMLDPEKKGLVSLDRLSALANKLKKDRKAKKHTLSKTSIDLLKAGLVLAVIVLVGIFSFIGLEYDEYQKQVDQNLKLKEEIELALPVRSIIVDILNLTSLYDEDLYDTIRAIYDNYTNETLWDQFDDNGFVSDYALRNPWHRDGAGWFIFTIITTVGYGHVVPNTFWGRSLVIPYSIPAILCMAYFIKMLSNFYKSWPCCYHIIRGPISIQVLILIVVFIVYLIVAGCIFAAHEEWSWSEGVYYTWVTISTIGFGDYTVVGNNAWRNTVHRSIFVNGIFLFSYVLTVVGNVRVYITKPERRNEVFKRYNQDKIALLASNTLYLGEDLENAGASYGASQPPSQNKTLGVPEEKAQDDSLELAQTNCDQN